MKTYSFTFNKSLNNPYFSHEVRGSIPLGSTIISMSKGQLPIERPLTCLGCYCVTLPLKSILFELLGSVVLSGF
jgi:hypothetical protein